MLNEEGNELYAVPKQAVGSQIDVVSHRKFKKEPKAEVVFNKAVKRLLSVNKWGNYAGISAFKLHDANGMHVSRLAAEGDCICIDIPGPGAKAGKGYDWVKIEEIQKHSNNVESWIAMRVRPCANPNSNENYTAHFLKDVATSTFIIRKVGIDIYAEEHGRNEVPNTDDVGIYDKGRNLIVALVAKLGLSYPQWKKLVNSLLND